MIKKIMKNEVVNDFGRNNEKCQSVKKVDILKKWNQKQFKDEILERKSKSRKCVNEEMKERKIILLKKIRKKKNVMDLVVKEG